MYDDVKSDIYGVFASSDWTQHNIKAYPDNYDGDVGAPTFVKLLILTASGRLGYSSKTGSGMLIISIFVKSGEGDAAYAAVSDILDTLFQGKTLANGTQFGASFTKVVGRDPSNQALYRVDYAINFNKYGD